MSAKDLQKSLRRWAHPKNAEFAQHFFRTGPGGYGEGDKFLGLTVPQTRKVVKNYYHLGFDQLEKLISSPIHEDRFAALVILLRHYAKGDLSERKRSYQFYWKNRHGINNWDLVDVSAPGIVGKFCLESKNPKPLFQMIASSRHWDRRVGMLGSFAFIRDGKPKVAFELAAKLLNDEQDLMHKASGWMLREAGKRDLVSLKKFIQRYGKKMPRTMLRYAIEKFPVAERKKILLQTKA